MGNVAASTINKMAFLPPKPPTYRKEDVNIWITRKKNKKHKIPAFHIRNGKPITLLVSHANAEDLGILLPYCRYLADRFDVDVFAYDYSGYGHADGEPSEANMYEDARAALDMLRDGFGLVPERDVVLYGKSIGSCPTSYLAARHLFRGVIIVSGLASGARVLFPDKKNWLMDAVAFNNLGSMRWNRSPVQIIHGDQDQTVPSESGKDLYSVCRSHHPLPPAWIQGANHNDVETTFSDQFVSSIREFLEYVQVTPRTLGAQRTNYEYFASSLRSLVSCGVNS